ncbi:GRIP and coiled-coil domain-containing protein 1-like [Teleopsis dalmanni]|uniref:GRIP and coiled-coil domain-containing protein 1-like n=1 Tax=Teleopsis dalmanni TaxID=139649 RepID=UPI0018CCD9A8|nr:GRIP and coiled-coil domain-containing protein 1-like [Teleopsis dalmanni]XP_037955349.1 GRIP and coiled-coil domain-containing protein 1-like [Teleopsis dalmanni]
MDRRSELENLVSTQKDTIARYEKRLKDVVTAYKGLLKEKEALEASLAAITTKSNQDVQLPLSVEATSANASQESLSKSISTSKEKENLNSSDLQTQIITLMNSLATLSAEKSRMEASFQGDKKQLRGQLMQKDEVIDELNLKIKHNENQSNIALEEVKAKWVKERQDRERETNNQMLMIRELQKLYGDERHLKENIEMQLNNFKTQFASNDAGNNQWRDLQAQLKEAKAQIKQLQAYNKKYGLDDAMDSSVVLKQVQLEMQQLKEQHAIAIKNEQKRALVAEEQSKKQVALHEVRVANLEARLAELSSSVGSYDRLRQQDQENIHSLKKKLQELERLSENYDSDSVVALKKSSSLQDTSGIVDEIIRLKKILLNENVHSNNSIDLSNIFAVNTDHSQCKEDLHRIHQQYDTAKIDILRLEEKLQVQKSHIATLQEKVKVLNRNIDEQETEIKLHSEKLRQAVKVERLKGKDALTELENEYRCKVNDLEQQLQKQRERSLQLLDEKEHEIKTLQTSFEIFQPSMPTVQLNKACTETSVVSSDAESVEGPTALKPKTGLKSKKLSVGENCHMLHYANEIARKDIEITGLRKSKYAAETALRKVIHEKVTAQEELSDQISNLEEQVDRLERCKTREGANLEYLKNVIISFMVSKDADGKRHMMNAISAVLQFTPTEIQTINCALYKK